MKLWFSNRLCSTRVSRVQFGVPPNWGCCSCGVGRLKISRLLAMRFRARRPKRPARRGCYPNILDAPVL